MINLILYIAILVSVVLIVYYGFDNYRKNKTISQQDVVLKSFAEREEEHRVKMLLRPKETLSPDEVNFAVDKTEINSTYLKIADFMDSLLQDSTIKKSYSEAAENLREDLLRKNGRQDESPKDVETTEGEELLANKIISAFSTLSKNELYLCVMLLQGKTTKEIAEATNREVRSVESSRNRLRKKLELEKGTDLREYLLLKTGDEEEMP